jgi:photosystem I subunit 9
MDSNFLKYLSTAPVLITVWLSFTAALVIEGNRFYPDMLYFPGFVHFFVLFAYCLWFLQVFANYFFILSGFCSFYVSSPRLVDIY